MKKLKTLTLKQKKFLENEGLDPSNYLLERATAEEYRFYDKSRNVIVGIRR